MDTNTRKALRMLADRVEFHDRDQAAAFDVLLADEPTPSNPSPNVTTGGKPSAPRRKAPASRTKKAAKSG